LTNYNERKTNIAQPRDTCTDEREDAAMKKTRRRIVCLLLTFVILGGSFAMGETGFYSEQANEAWYQEMLQNGILAPGNNYRLKKLIQRAQDGEEITVAAIGGSITEGAGAKEYKECYAARFFRGFAARYGKDGGRNVRLVNAGVGGTPSPFGLMRYQRDVVDRVQDPDGLPDLVVIEFSVNDWGEPTKHRAFESLVKTILQQPNEPAVILLFAVFQNGFNLQGELKSIGDAYGLMMVSIKDAAFPHVGKEWTAKEFFHDEYHPTSLGHGVMADCLLYAVDAAAARETDAQDASLDVSPAYGTDFMGLITLYGSGDYPENVTLDRGGFARDDMSSYTNLPVGRVGGINFSRDSADPNAPLTFKAVFKKLLIAWRATNDARFGEAEILVDGKVKRTLKGAADKWGQSEVILLWDSKDSLKHTVEIRMAEGSETKRFTITAISYVP